MRVEITQFHNIENSLAIKVHGIWDQADLNKKLPYIQAQNPDYIVVDPSHTMLKEAHLQPVEDTTSDRRFALETIAKMLQANPDMLYIILNPNNNPAITTAYPFFVERGLGDRYLFATDENEALQIIKRHQANQKSL